MTDDLMSHQTDALARMTDKHAFALLPEPGTGKSRIILEDAQRLFVVGKIKQLIVIAPAGVDRKWGAECAKWLTSYQFFLWSNSTSIKMRVAKTEYMQFTGALKVAAFSIDSLITKAGRSFIETLLKSCPSMLVIDESTRIKNPKALRTKAAIGLAALAKYRRILTGTPITQSIADSYSQFTFLDSDIIGIKSYFAFKRRYMYESTGYGPGGRTFQKFEGIKNEQDFLNKIKPYSYRITKEECLDLPPKMYERHYVELSVRQRQAYNDLRENFILELSESKDVTAELALTRFGKLQQIIGNFIKDESGVYHTIDKESNPRIDALLDIIDSHADNTKFVIWAKFTQEIRDIVKALRLKYPDKKITEYYGAVGNDQRHEGVDSFQSDPNCLFFVGNAQIAGIGLDLFAANNVIYYSNTFSLEDRTQSEDRCHRKGQLNKVTYYDLEAVDTIDAKVLTALQNKQELADLIMKNIGSKNVY